MKNPNFVLLYVDDPAKSAAFYSRILQRPAIESSENFAMMALATEVMLGLWVASDVEPKSSVKGGGAEIGFPAESKEAVDECFRKWSAEGMKIAQEPTQMDFGYTFTALDPDGHRLRVYCPADGK